MSVDPRTPFVADPDVAGRVAKRLAHREDLRVAQGLPGEYGHDAGPDIIVEEVGPDRWSVWTTDGHLKLPGPFTSPEEAIEKEKRYGPVGEVTIRYQDGRRETRTAGGYEEDEAALLETLTVDQLEWVLDSWKRPPGSDDPEAAEYVAKVEEVLQRKRGGRTAAYDVERLVGDATRSYMTDLVSGMATAAREADIRPFGFQDAREGLIAWFDGTPAQDPKVDVCLQYLAGPGRDLISQMVDAVAEALRNSDEYAGRQIGFRTVGREIAKFMSNPHYGRQAQSGRRPTQDELLALMDVEQLERVRDSWKEPPGSDDPKAAEYVRIVEEELRRRGVGRTAQSGIQVGDVVHAPGHFLGDAKVVRIFEDEGIEMAEIAPPFAPHRNIEVALLKPGGGPYGTIEGRTAQSWVRPAPDAHVCVWFYHPGDPKPVTEVTAEVVRSPSRRMQGLQGREQLHPATGMLFLDPRGPGERPEQFHMGTVKFPIDIVFLRSSGQIGRIIHNIQPGDPGHWGYPKTAAVVELVGGFCRAHGIAEGDKVGYGKVARTATLARQAAEFRTPTSVEDCKRAIQRAERAKRKAEAELTDARSAGYEIGIRMWEERVAEYDAAIAHFERWLSEHGHEARTAAPFRALACPACGTNRNIQAAPPTWGSAAMADKLAGRDTTRCIGCGFEGPIAKFDTALPTEYRMRSGRTAQSKDEVKRWMRRNVSKHVDPRTNEVNTTSLAEDAADYFGHNEKGGWLDDETHWIWDAAVEVGWAHQRNAQLTVPSVPSAKPEEGGGSQSGSEWKEPKRSQSIEPPALCQSCGKDATGGYEMPGEGLLCPDCADAYVESEDGIEQEAAGVSHDPLRSLTEA